MISPRDVELLLSEAVTYKKHRQFFFVEPQTECWVWQRALTGSGYGVIQTPEGQRRAHRFVYELVRGPIPPELVVDHLCERRSCVNPDHMEIVPQGVNAVRGSSSPTGKNARKTHCDRGHELSGENLLMKDGRRQCRTCYYAANRAYAARKRGSSAPAKPAGSGSTTGAEAA